MKVLQFCHKSPFPPKEGGPIAVNNITEGLIDAGHRVKVFAISTPKTDMRQIDMRYETRDKSQISNLNSENLNFEEYVRKTGFEYEHIDTSVRIIPAILNLFSNESYNINRFISEKVEAKLIEILKNNEFDIVQLESLFVTPYIKTIREYSKAKIVLRSHNIEFLVWERLGKTYKNPFARVYIKYLSRKLKNYEISMLNKFDGIATITSEDADLKIKCGCNIPITDIPFGVNIEKYREETKTTTTNKISDTTNPGTNPSPNHSLFFIGSMDWKPNQEGLKWFIKEVLNKLRIENGDLRIKFYIAGRNFPEWLIKLNIKNQKSNVVIVGEVEDAIKFISSKDIMIVPLFSGSGVRVKVIEGMALGKVIISTSIGAEGINYENKKNILIADTNEKFSECILLCLNKREICNQIGENAMELIRREHNIKLIIDKLVRFYKEI